MTRKIGIIVGSLRKDSFSKLTARTFSDMLPDGYEPVWLRIDDLPFYNPDLEDEDTAGTKSWRRLRTELSELSGVMFFTPEYNRGLPAVLKNALDVGSRSTPNVWANKPALVVSVSPGGIGGFGANHSLRQSLTFLNMPVLQQPEAYIGGVVRLIENGEFVAGTKDFFASILDSYLAFLDKLTQ